MNLNMKCAIILYAIFFVWSIFELKRGWKILVLGEESYNIQVHISFWLIDKFGNEGAKEKFLKNFLRQGTGVFEVLLV